MTILDVISGAARLLGVTAIGESLGAQEASDGLTTLVTMLDSWSNESLLVNALTEDDLTLIASKQSYTIGSGGDFSVTRPQRIERAAIRQGSGSTAFDLPMEIINNDQWVDIGVKGITSNFPTKLYPEYTYPLATIQLWPSPSAANSLILWSWKPFSTSSLLLTTTVTFPPGYNKAIIYNLALELAPEYGREPSALIVAQAEQAKKSIKRMNKRTHLLEQDAAVLQTRAGFNWLTGE